MIFKRMYKRVMRSFTGERRISREGNISGKCVQEC